MSFILCFIIMNPTRAEGHSPLGDDDLGGG